MGIGCDYYYYCILILLSEVFGVRIIEAVVIDDGGMEVFSISLSIEVLVVSMMMWCMWHYCIDYCDMFLLLVYCVKWHDVDRY